MRESGFERFILTLKALSYAYDIDVIFEHGKVYMHTKTYDSVPKEVCIADDKFKELETFEQTIQSLKGQNMEDYKLKIGDDVTINATIVGVTPNNNPIIKLESGIKFLVKETDINTICPKSEPPKEDMRKGN